MQSPNDTNASDGGGSKYLIRLSLPEADWEDAWELCRGIERCGGHRSKYGFAFCSADERAEALQILEERFGERYFEPLDVLSDNEAVRILVATPHEDRRHEYCSYLAQIGFRVAEASHGLACLESLRREPPDITVLHRDLLWGGGDGVVECMRQDCRWSGIPVVLLTRPRRRLFTLTGQTPPVFATLQEPVSPRKLLSTIQRLVPATELQE
jgi:CheY-like chemotaxis protein